MVLIFKVLIQKYDRKMVK